MEGSKGTLLYVSTAVHMLEGSGWSRVQLCGHCEGPDPSLKETNAQKVCLLQLTQPVLNNSQPHTLSDAIVPDHESF